MKNLVIWYPLFYSLLTLLGAFVGVLLDVLVTDFSLLVAKRRTKLRDKMHFAMSQTVKRAET